MARKNRKQSDETQGDEIIDADSVRIRRPFETAVRDYVTADDGNILLAEEGKGAAWIETESDVVLNARDCI